MDDIECILLHSLGHEQWGLVGEVVACHLWGLWARLRLGCPVLPAAVQDASHTAGCQPHFPSESEKGRDLPESGCLNPGLTLPAGPPPLGPQPGRELQAAQSETQVSWRHSQGRPGAFRFSF